MHALENLELYKLDGEAVLHQNGIWKKRVALEGFDH